MTVQKVELLLFVFNRGRNRLRVVVLCPRSHTLVGSQDLNLQLLVDILGLSSYLTAKESGSKTGKWVPTRRTIQVGP